MNENESGNHYASRESVAGSISRAKGEEALRMMRDLIKTMNGNMSVESGVDLSSKLFAFTKKMAVSGNLSVVVQQPTAIPRALAMIDGKYILQGLTELRFNRTWAEMKRHCPIVLVKENGYFDTNMTKSMHDRAAVKQNRLFQALGLTDAGVNNWGDAMTWAASKGDQINWVQLWRAVKNETLDQHAEVEEESEEFWKICNERFTDIVSATQVYDSVLSRCEWARSKGLKQYPMAYMSEPITQLNMLMDAVQQCARTKNWKQTARVFGAVIAANTLNGLVKSFVAALRDDDYGEKDEDKDYVGYNDYWERYWKAVGSSMVESYTGMVPYLNSVVSVIQGYTPTQPDMQMVVKAYQSVSNLIKIPDTDLETMNAEKAWAQVDKWTKAGTTVLAIATRLPIHNIYRDLSSIANTFLYDSGLLKAKGRCWDTSLPLSERVESAWHLYKKGSVNPPWSDLFASLALAVLVSGDFITVTQSGLIKDAITGVLTALAGFGVLNNPTNKAGL